ncbi:Cytochrome P450 [Canna indica]|uniref:Cytochrome P450 n=1 Tax=Canna indica TaxID=4628 RepID=A0AAQ3KYQ0_9LILI|nr:Cytochrome P450 [Canna indica]
MFMISNAGRTSFTWFGTVPRVTITDPEMVREILSKKFDHFGRANISPLGRWLASGVLSYEGEKWAKHRRILNPAFHAEKLKQMLPAFSACCSDLVVRWANFVSLEGSYELDVWPELQSFARDVISRAAFGSSIEEGRRIFEHQAELANEKLCWAKCGFLPTPRNNRVKAIDREVRSIIGGMTKKREEAIKMGGESKDDLLGLLMESNMKQYQEHGNKKAGLTTEEVIEECKPFYFAGQETASVLLTWTMVVLSMHPNWQVRAREEVLQEFGKDKPDSEGLSHLKIVTMILYEVLRLYPPVILLQRKAYDKIKIGNITYPPGLFFALPMISIHHYQELWGKDASEFKPERFSEGVAKASKYQVAFFPFSGGPRICIGQNFVLLEAKMGLAMILQRFSFELSPSYTHAPHIHINLQPQHGAQLRLHKL